MYFNIKRETLHIFILIKSNNMKYEEYLLLNMKIENMRFLLKYPISITEMGLCLNFI